MNTEDIDTVLVENSGSDRKKNVTRDLWANKVQSFLSILGATIGPGNIWRFPYIAYENGGGAFLIPYIVFALLCGFPLFFAEIALGQYTRQGAVGAWKVAPIMKGVGIGSVFISLYTSFYYVVVMAWSTIYFVHSFFSPLPWMTCENWWNTNSCLPYQNLSSFSANETAVYFNADSKSTDVALPMIEYWNNFILRKSSGIHEIGSLTNWPLVVGLLFCYVVVYFSIFMGVKSSGKVLYVTATAPYVVLSILLVRTCTLDGAIDGIIYYLKPNLTKLLEPNVWIQAGTQVCYSFGICFTLLIAFGSYNEYHRNCYTNSIALVISCGMTSFVVGFAVFGVLGNLAKILHIDIANVVSSGPGLVFVTYPIGLSLMPIPQLWNVLFFLMFITVVIDGQFACMEGVITVCCDYSPYLQRHRKLFTSAFCVILFLFGLIFGTEGGVYIFELFNNYAVSGIALLWLALMESIGIAWVYGADKFCDNIEDMIGYYPCKFFKMCLKYIAPIICSSIMIFYMVNYKPLIVMGYVYPFAANAIGWVLCMSSFLCVPIFAIYELCKHKGSLKERLKKAAKPIFLQPTPEKCIKFREVKL